MEQDERAVVDLSEGNTEQDGEATAPATAVILATEVDKEGVSEVDGSVRGAVSESAKKQDLEEPSPEADEVAEASGRIEKGDGEAFDNPAAIATPLELRSAAADATPAPILMRFTAAGHAEQAGSEAAVLGAPSSSAPAPASGTHEDVPAMANGDQGAAPGARWAIAHASPRDSPKRSEPPPASASETREASDDDTASSASSSKRPPSRSRKQPRSEHFIREEAEATASAKARRSDDALDTFLTCQVLRCPASRSEWAKNVTADDS
ncbi:unnamed protein product [Alopecurus aequalis]